MERDMIGVQQSSPDAMAALRGRMNASPTGRQLAIDGSLVADLYDDDPNTTDIIPPDGALVLYSRAATLELWAFTRATGWQQIT